jgi:four helix bundle protein
MYGFRTYQLALELNRDSVGIRLKGPIQDQYDRAVLSIALNLAEGGSRIGKDRVHFFRIAYGSCREVQACLTIAGHPLFAKADELGGMIYRLIENPGRGPKPLS